MTLSIALCLTLSQLTPVSGGCTKDTDCKGDRICEAGVCVSPGSPAPAPAPAPPPPPTVEASPPPEPPPAPPVEAPADFPRVVRREGQVCVQTLEADGQIAESCRADAPARVAPLPTDAAAPPPTATKKRATEPPASRVVSDLQLHGGALVGFAGNATGVLADVGATFAVGGRFSSGVGLVGVGNLELGAGSSTVIVGTLGPALRLGDRTHATFTLGPSVIAYLPGGAGLAASFIASSLFAVTRAFGITVHGAVHLHALGVAVTFGAGIGFGAL